MRIPICHSWTWSRTTHLDKATRITSPAMQAGCRDGRADSDTIYGDNSSRLPTAPMTQGTFSSATMVKSCCSGLPIIRRRERCDNDPRRDGKHVSNDGYHWLKRAVTTPSQETRAEI